MDSQENVEIYQVLEDVRKFLIDYKNTILTTSFEVVIKVWQDLRNDVLDTLNGCISVDTEIAKKESRTVNTSILQKGIDGIDAAIEMKNPIALEKSLMDLIQYMELPEKLYRIRAKEGIVFAQEAITRFEYVYTHPEVEEMRVCVDNEMETKQVNIFHFPFDEAKYNIQTGYDADADMYYIMQDGMKVYFPKSMYASEEEVKNYVKILCIEQEEESPHRYLNKRMEVPEGAVVIDAGVAEANFAVSIINKVKKIYLVECDTNWLEALKWTFKDHMDKIEIIPKFLSNVDNEECITVDTIMNGEPLDYLKMDIEGAEVDALQGAKNTLENSPNLKCNICVYHKLHDNEVIVPMLEEAGMDVENTKGYMSFHDDEEYPYYPRRGLAQAVKKME